MSNVLYYDLGQIATIVLETKSSSGNSIDPISPIISALYTPKSTKINGFPLEMTKLGSEDGIFIAKITLPKEPKDAGTYLCIVKWINPETKDENKSIYTIIVRNLSKSTSTRITPV